jgi:RNA polymerase sigma-70 factor (ECF subfamily)
MSSDAMTLQRRRPGPLSPAAAVAEAGLDEARFRALYDGTAVRLRGYLRRVSGDAALADDILQETYLRLLRARPEGGPDVENAAFVFKIATNLLYDHWRRQRRERGFLERLWPTAAPSADASLQHDVGRLLLELKPRERALLWLAHVEGWSHVEIAGTLELHRASVRVLLFRARARLMRVLARAGVGSEVLR